MPARVMVIDDSPIFREIMKDVIDDFALANNLDVSLTLWDDWRREESLVSIASLSDLVFLDINLGRFNGLKLLPFILESEKPRVVMFSSSRSAGEISSAYQMGAFLYLGKTGGEFPFEGKINSVLSTILLAAEAWW